MSRYLSRNYPVGSLINTGGLKNEVFSGRLLVNKIVVGKVGSDLAIIDIEDNNQFIEELPSGLVFKVINTPGMNTTAALLRKVDDRGIATKFAFQYRVEIGLYTN